MKRKTLQKIIRFLMRTLTVTEFDGLENIPETGGVIIATNHLSYLDIPLLFINPVRKDITALVTTKYKSHSFIRWFTDTAEGIWINRDIADFTAIRKASKALAEKKALGISPEGTRSTNRKLAQGKQGTAMLALRANVPIVPVAVYGTEIAFEELRKLHRPLLFAKFGKAFTLPPIDEKDARADILKQYSEMIMLRIAELLPKKYRGVYEGHPSLK